MTHAFLKDDPLISLAVTSFLSRLSDKKERIINSWNHIDLRILCVCVYNKILKMLEATPEFISFHFYFLISLYH